MMHYLPLLQQEEMANGAVNINIPGFQANRDLVAYPDGGLYNHMVLTFDPSLNTKHFCKPDEQFQYPVLENVTRPQSDEDLAYMTVRYIFYFYVSIPLIC